ncbi:hypothetical protein N657DRAFT_647003 [Parathielavia appendiculata]|uniref:Coenzyme Q-binding protein COQ10 START domain-containing protein n=1 Tax=Parathielavia appendiculata TaxID=2587402 RepID=A0AAN6Z2C5_9PEZI|nr:hypothetical protein N657DRAFT_647003 [Parathielavia appendiculata]
MAQRLPPATRNFLTRLPPAAASPSFLLRPKSTSAPPRSFSLPSKPTTRRLTTTTSRPFLLSALSNLAPKGSSSSQQQQPASKTLRACRLLPYPPQQIYTLIADIDSYRHFLPHCAHSHVTRWTTPTSSPTTKSDGGEGNDTPQPPTAAAVATTSTTTTRLHPALADLTVGWGPFTQTYTSRVYCVPGQVVEAVSGASAETSIPRETLRAVGYSDADLDLDMRVMEGGIFESLVTRWTVKPVPRLRQEEEYWTEVTLSVTFRFANPALGFAVGQVADDKVDEMVEAFEARARKLYGRR